MITLTIIVDGFPDGEVIEDAVAVVLGGLGYTGHLVCNPTMNEVSFPVTDAQALSIAENAITNAQQYVETEDAE